MKDGRTLILEIKGYETDEEKAKHAVAKRWVSAVNNWGNLGRWCFHVCRDPHLIGKELEHIIPIFLSRDRSQANKAL
jgi:type III restriction enzyme